MKSLILAAALIGSSAFAANTLIDEVAKDAGVNTACATRIMLAVQKRCNSDSLAAEGKDRMNPCQDFDADVATEGDSQGKVEAGGYAGDADGYWYTITIRDAGLCKFSLAAQQ